MKIKNGFKYEINGWKYISISGKPYERGFAHGKLLKKEIKKCISTMKWNLYNDYGFDARFFTLVSNYVFKKYIEDHYPEYYSELHGIANGSKSKIDEIILWNNYASLPYALSSIKDNLHNMSTLMKEYGDILENVDAFGSIMEGGSADKCSAFMAVGDYTHDGKICCAHNSFDDFITGQYFNVIIDIKPNKGNRILFQSAPGYISSQTDFFITSNGFIGTETTFGGFNNYVQGSPISCRIRCCMQYAKTLDDYVSILKKHNSGDYANAWLIGNTNTNEIMRIELGLEFVNVEKKKNGYFIGFNAPYDPRIRNIESSNTGFDDIRRHQGARKVRLEQLMDKNKGKINIDIAKNIIADHYDVYLNKDNKCSRTICSHYELDAREYMSQADRPLPYAPRGAVDGCVADTKLCKNMSFYGRWGSSCGTPFIVKDYIKKNMQWKRYQPYLNDRPSQPWTLFTINKKNTRHNKTNRIKSKKNTLAKNNHTKINKTKKINNKSKK